MIDAWTGKVIIDSAGTVITTYHLGEAVQRALTVASEPRLVREVETLGERRRRQSMTALACLVAAFVLVILPVAMLAP